MKRVRVSGPALRDIANVLRRSEEDFGARARDRYRRLIDRALNDLAREPDRAGVRSIEDVRQGYLIYHLNFSRGARAKAAVRRPGHAIVFTVDERGDVIVARLFHERQLPEHHLDPRDG